MAHGLGLWLVRCALQRGLAAIYLIAFVEAFCQFRPLLGDRGLLPVRDHLQDVRFVDAPSLFHFHYSDRFFGAVALLGIALSAAAVLGLCEAGPVWLSFGTWLVLWALYLSIVNVGQTFYGFGWESMLLEAGFFASFLGPARMAPSLVPLLLLRWMLFRVEIGAGLIKLRHDRCWRDLTCLYYHYETQPLPNPLSWYFHRLPRRLHRGSVAFSHFVQLVVPFGFFAPQPVASIAGGLAIFHQLCLIVSGNYSWLNWLTVALGVSTFSDAVLRHVLPVGLPIGGGAAAAAPGFYGPLEWALVGMTLVLSIKPVLNLFSRRQAMNLSYNSLHLVNTYGAFGSISKERREVVLEGSEAEDPEDPTGWREYELKGKPGDPRRRPPQVAPYHLRLDWMLWFLPLSGRGMGGDYETWFIRLVGKLLAADRGVLRLLRRDPFAGRRPRFVRARLYRYRFTSLRERRESGRWWNRTELGDYLPPLSADDVERLDLG
jgi:hypothetical protein